MSVDGLHLTPISSVLQIRPTLTYLDEMDAKNKASSKKMADMDRPITAEATKAIQVLAVQTEHPILIC